MSPFAVPGRWVMSDAKGGVTHMRILFLLVAALAGVSFAAVNPVAALNLSTVASGGLTTLNTMVTQALPFIVGAIGLSIGIRWMGRFFRAK
jgi:hypothetical protein